MADRNADQRRRALRRGLFSEYLAAFSLMLRGYRILAMRYRAKAGEIDIIARKGDLVSFIEVKARATAASSVFASVRVRICPRMKSSKLCIKISHV